MSYSTMFFVEGLNRISEKELNWYWVNSGSWRPNADGIPGSVPQVAFMPGLRSIVSKRSLFFVDNAP